jgi:polyhydroxyalkanoate synthesis regulator phasin
MLETLQKILYTGIGFAALTEEKAREIVADLEKRGEVSSEEGKKLAQELIEKTKKQSEHFRQTVTEEVHRLAEKFKWVSQEEFQELKQRLDELEKRCAPTDDDSL